MLASEGLGESRRRGEVDRAQVMFGPTLSVEISTTAPQHSASRGIGGLFTAVSIALQVTIDSRIIAELN